MSRAVDRAGWIGSLFGALVVVLVLNGGAALIESAGGRRPQAQGPGSLAFFASVVLVPVGVVVGSLVGRWLGRPRS